MTLNWAILRGRLLLESAQQLISQVGAKYGERYSWVSNGS